MIRVIRDGQVTNIGPNQEWLQQHTEMGSFGDSFTWEEFDPEMEQECINMKAREYLRSTDWYIIRWMDSETEPPEEIIRLRAEARARIV